jgi:hypothetical protein
VPGAHLLVLLGSGVLTFCRHHGRHYAAALTATGAQLIDDAAARPAAA